MVLRDCRLVQCHGHPNRLTGKLLTDRAIGQIGFIVLPRACATKNSGSKKGKCSRLGNKYWLIDLVDLHWARRPCGFEDQVCWKPYTVPCFSRAGVYSPLNFGFHWHKPSVNTFGYSIDFKMQTRNGEVHSRTDASSPYYRVHTCPSCRVGIPRRRIWRPLLLYFCTRKTFRCTTDPG